MLRPSRGVSASLKFRAEIHPYNRFKSSSLRILTYLIFHPALKAEGTPTSPGNRAGIFCTRCPFFRHLSAGVLKSPCSGVRRWGWGGTAGAGAAPRARAGPGEGQRCDRCWLSGRAGVGKSIKICIRLLMKKCGREVNKRDLIYFQLKLKRDQNRGSN